MGRGVDGMLRALGKAHIPHSVPQSVHCPKGCGEHLQFGVDAIGRETSRCPKCDGVAKPRKINPNEALIPQGLVAGRLALPPARPGQPCAHCGHRVPKPRRPPTPPTPEREAELKALRPDLCCRGCGDPMPPTGARRREWCDKPECLEKAPESVRKYRQRAVANALAKGGR